MFHTPPKLVVCVGGGVIFIFFLVYRLGMGAFVGIEPWLFQGIADAFAHSTKSGRRGRGGVLGG